MLDVLRQTSVVITEQGKMAIILNVGLPADKILNFTVKEKVIALLADDEVFCETEIDQQHVHELLEKIEECAVFEMKNGTLEDDCIPKIAYKT